jgi:hypothetical protein
MSACGIARVCIRPVDADSDADAPASPAGWVDRTSESFELLPPAQTTLQALAAQQREAGGGASSLLLEYEFGAGAIGKQLLPVLAAFIFEQ